MLSLYQSVKTVLIKEMSPTRYYSQFKKKWQHILLGGSLDALTTIIGLSVFSLQELNPIVNHLMPNNVHFIPFVLVEMAFLRYAVVSAIFKETKYLNLAVYFTLYFLPIWNTVNMIYKHVV